jgi:hypothetical protein
MTSIRALPVCAALAVLLASGAAGSGGDPASARTGAGGPGARGSEARSPAARGPEARGAARQAVTLLPLVAFPAIHSALVSDYTSGQLKLTYQGAQGKITTSLAVVCGSRAGGFDLTAFPPFEHRGSYANDGYFGDTLLVSAAELKAFLDGIALYPALQDTTPPSVPHVSLMVMRDPGTGRICWEHITGSYADGDTLYRLLHDALTDAAQRATVDHFRHHQVGVRR